VLAPPVSVGSFSMASRKTKPPPPAAAPEAPAPVKELRSWRGRIVYYLTFIGAVLALSRAIYFYNVLTGSKEAALSEAGAWACFLGWSAALLFCVGVLGLFIYEGERSKGTLRRRVALYERLLARTEGEKGS